MLEMQYLLFQVLQKGLYRNLALAAACVFIVTLLLIANLWTSTLVFTCVAFTVACVLQKAFFSFLLNKVRPGVVAQSEACPLCMQAAVSSIPTPCTFFHGDLVMKYFYGHSPSSADSRRVVVCYWRKNVH